jgi:hypothetical protein
MHNHAIALFGACLLLGSCATVKQNVDARALLAKCRYEYAGIDVTGVDFGKGIEIDSVDFDVRVKIENTVDKDIAVDHAALSFDLDRNHVLDLAHNRFVRIAPAAAAVEPVSVKLPFAGMIKSLGHRPEKIGLHAKLWVTLLVGKETWETPIMLPIDVEVPIPYDRIDAIIAQRKQQLEDEAKAKISKEASKLAPEVKLPHF